MLPMPRMTAVKYSGEKMRKKMRNSLRKTRNSWKMMKNLMKTPMLFLMKRRGKMNSLTKVNSKKMNLTKESFPVLIYPMRP